MVMFDKIFLKVVYGTFIWDISHKWPRVFVKMVGGGMGFFV